MKTIVFLCTAVFILSTQSCKKGGDDPIVPPVKTDSLGTGWTKSVVAGTDFYDIFFNNHLSGYAVGNKIYKSTDGGSSWQLLFNDSNYYNLFVTADEKAFFLKSGNGLMQTTPAFPALAKTIAAPNDGATDIFFIDNYKGYYIGNNKLYTTTDGGSTWNPGGVSLQIWPTYASLFFINSSTGWIVNGNRVFKTDGQAISTPVTLNTNTYITSIHALSVSVLYLGANSGKIFKSSDGGNSFVLKAALPSGNGFTDIHFINEFTGYASVDGRIFKTTDAADSWVQVVSLADVEIKEIHFTDSNHGWACGIGGTVLVFRQ